MKSVAGNSSAPSSLRQSLTTPRTLLRAGIIQPGPKAHHPSNACPEDLRPTIAGGYAVAHERMPDSVAIIDEAGQWTLVEMNLRGRQLARELHSTGVSKGSRVGFLARNHSAFVQTMLACGRLGADTVLLNTGPASSQLAATVENDEVSTLVLDHGATASLGYSCGDPGRERSRGSAGHRGVDPCRQHDAVRRVHRWSHQEDLR